MPRQRCGCDYALGGGALAGGTKFGTFGGVFTPSILTILGVILYMRLPWVIGHAGLYLAVGIVLAAHIISVTTGLSVASIATDKRVAAGGAYYIVSRSMGLAIGGTLGLALFTGLSFSISLYLIGFSESFLDYWGLPTDIAAVRICGTVALLALTFVTFVSTSLAIRTQYAILGLIVASLVSIFAGAAALEIPEVPHLYPLPDGKPAATLFGIFFPAVTGFTAGVNMSGDLKNPRASIPIGTIAAIAVGLVVYLVLVFFLAFGVDPTDLADDEKKLILLDVARWPSWVVGGIWGATISSALGSILGAPRILAALSLDRITPQWLGIGHGAANEPRFALLVAVLIGEAGILIGELDAIARLVSMFFMATYGFLNLSASFEMIASPDFRPDFRIPRIVPVIGAVTCAVLMIWLDLGAMLGAVAVMSALFVLIKRRELQLETGDAWLGVWSSIVRAGLRRLTTERQHQRNWSPNLLLFTGDQGTRDALVAFAAGVTRQRGLATEFALTRAPAGPIGAPRAALPLGGSGAGQGAEGADEEKKDEAADGGTDELFCRDLPAGDQPLQTMAQVCRYHGFAGVDPNTVLIDWGRHSADPRGLARFLDTLDELDFNVLALASAPGAVGLDRPQPRIDLWWRAGAGSLAFGLALLRLVTAIEDWRRAELRFLVISADPALTDTLHRAAIAALEDARVDGKVKVVDPTIEYRTDDDWIAHLSANAELTVVGIPDGAVGAEDIEALTQLSDRLPRVLFVRPSAQFHSEFDTVAAANASRRATPAPVSRDELVVPDLQLPAVPDLAAPAQRFVDAHEAMLDAFCDRAVRLAFDGRSSLLRRLGEAIDEQYQQLALALQRRDGPRRQRVFGPGAVTVMRRSLDALKTFEEQGATRQAASLATGVEQLIASLEELEAQTPARLSVARPAADFAPAIGDPPHLRRLKTRRRWLGLRKQIRYTIRPRRLARYYLRHETTELAQTALRDVASNTLLFTEDLGRLFKLLRDSLSALRRDLRDGVLTSDQLQIERQRIAGRLVSLADAQQEGGVRKVVQLLNRSREIHQAWASDLDRIDLGRLTRRERRVKRASGEQIARLAEAPDRWRRTASLLFRRAQLAPMMAAVQLRLGSAVADATTALTRALDEGMSAECTRLRDRLATYREQLVIESDCASEGDDAEAPAIAWSVIHPGVRELQPRVVGREFDEGPIVDGLSRALRAVTGSVPAAMSLMSEASVRALATDPLVEVAAVEVDLRRQLQFIVDSQLVGPIQELLADVPRAEQRARSVAEDVVRLISFQASDLGPQAAAEIAAILGPVVDNGIARLDAEIERLAELRTSLVAGIADRLEAVNDVTQGLAVLGTAEAFEAHGGGAVVRGLSRFGRLTQRLVAEVNRALVTLTWRRSSGVLLARRVRSDRDRAVVDRVLALVDATNPRPEVVDALPFYYGQLFLGASAVHSAFWVGRDEELAAIGRAVDRYERGYHGALVIAGEPGAGRSALVEVAVERHLAHRTVHRIAPPLGGSAELAVFQTALETELRRSGSIESLMDALPDGSVLLLHDLELWWERSDRGFEVLEAVLAQLERVGDRVLFVLEIGTFAYRLLNAFLPLEAEALAVVECAPVDAETLKDIVLQRHSATGLRFAIDDRPEGTVSDWSLAELFTALFHRCDGNVGSALYAWVAGVRSFDGSVLTIAELQPVDDDALNAIPMDALAVLVQLVLHKQLTLERLARVSGLSPLTIRRELGTLRRMGLVGQRRREVVELEPGPRTRLVASLARRGLLP